MVCRISTEDGDNQFAEDLAEGLGKARSAASPRAVR